MGRLQLCSRRRVHQCPGLPRSLRAPALLPVSTANADRIGIGDADSEHTASRRTTSQACLEGKRAEMGLRRVTAVARAASGNPRWPLDLKMPLVHCGGGYRRCVGQEVKRRNGHFGTAMHGPIDVRTALAGGTPHASRRRCCGLPGRGALAVHHFPRAPADNPGHIPDAALAVVGSLSWHRLPGIEALGSTGNGQRKQPSRNVEVRVYKWTVFSVYDLSSKCCRLLAGAAMCPPRDAPPPFATAPCPRP